jgi:hypothetical protein
VTVGGDCLDPEIRAVPQTSGPAPPPTPTLKIIRPNSLDLPKNPVLSVMRSVI